MNYKDKVGKMLLDIPVGNYFDIMANVKPDNIPMFIEVVKSYIDMRMGHKEGWFIEFTNDYTKIRKNGRWRLIAQEEARQREWEQSHPAKKT